MTSPPAWTDAEGVPHYLPAIDYQIEQRLKRWGLVDLYSATTRPAKWEELFSSLAGDAELIVNLCYALEHQHKGPQDEQEAFARLFCPSAGEGERSSADIIKEASEGLLQVVVDFFPSDARESTRQWLSLYLTQQALETFPQEHDLEGWSSEMPESGLSTCSEPLELTETASA